MKNIGNRYEQKAVDYLISKGYEIYKRNLRLNRREIDIIAIDKVNSITVLVEVKYRKNYFPQISQKQINNLIESGYLLQWQEQLPIFWRIDLIVFIKNQLLHYENIILKHGENNLI